MKLFFALVALALLSIAGSKADTTNESVDALIQGRKFVLELLEQHPTDNLVQTGVLKIRDAKGQSSEIPIKCEVVVRTNDWRTTYLAICTNNPETLTVTHPYFRRDQFDGDFPGSDRGGYFIVGLSNIQIGFPSSYEYSHSIHQDPTAGEWKSRTKDHLIPFAGSDFWQCDLGLEFFHWSQQKILPKTTSLKRGREYTLLESTNPNPPTNGYSRVLSWIDKESGGILQAEAYDSQGKLLKMFEPKSFKKVNGQWQLQEMQIENVQTGSRTRLEFDLKN